MTPPAFLVARPPLLIVGMWPSYRRVITTCFHVRTTSTICDYPQYARPRRTLLHLLWLPLSCLRQRSTSSCRQSHLSFDGWVRGSMRIDLPAPARR